MIERDYATTLPTLWRPGMPQPLNDAIPDLGKCGWRVCRYCPEDENEWPETSFPYRNAPICHDCYNRRARQYAANRKRKAAAV